MSQKSISILLAIVMVFISFSINAVEEYRIIINKNDKELVVKKSNTIIKKYHIATGKGGKGTKRERGDSKTPLGVYRVTKLKKSSRFHYFIQLSYPNLIDAWYGFKNEVIDNLLEAYNLNHKFLISNGYILLNPNQEENPITREFIENNIDSIYQPQIHKTSFVIQIQTHHNPDYILDIYFIYDNIFYYTSTLLIHYYTHHENTYTNNLYTFICTGFYNNSQHIFSRYNTWI